MFDNTMYYYKDNSKLITAWRRYYQELGLAYNKLNSKVRMRVSKGKYPNKK